MNTYESFYSPPYNMYYYYPFNYDLNNYNQGYSVSDLISYNNIQLDYVKNNTSKPRSLCFYSNKKQYIELSSINTSIEKGITISMWFFPINCIQNTHLFDFNNLIHSTRLYATIQDNNFISVSYSNKLSQFSIQLPYKNNKWNHLLIVFNPYNTWDGYMNGKKIITIKNECPVLVNGSKNCIGINISSNIFYNGYIDDFRFYKNALSKNEIENIILKGAWKLFEKYVL